MTMQDDVKNKDPKIYGFIVGAIVKQCASLGHDKIDISDVWVVRFANDVAKAWEKGEIDNHGHVVEALESKNERLIRALAVQRMHEENRAWIGSQQMDEWVDQEITRIRQEIENA